MIALYYLCNCMESLKKEKRNKKIMASNAFFTVGEKNNGSQKKLVTFYLFTL